MAFGKPKNPLLELVHPAHEDFHIDRLEARMIDANAVPIKCGCAVVRTLRGRVVRRCPQHEKYNEPMPEPPKEKA